MKYNVICSLRIFTEHIHIHAAVVSNVLFGGYVRFLLWRLCAAPLPIDSNDLCAVLAHDKAAEI